ncbi:MAG: hypothetical protein H6619_02570 [Deltaproteobacteria bacterium]|nr:hypothetical protein [Deltaproteobacteria bacterium]
MKKLFKLSFLTLVLFVIGCSSVPKSAPIAEPDYDPTCKECVDWKKEMEDRETKPLPDEYKANAQALLEKCNKLLGNPIETGKIVSCPGKKEGGGPALDPVTQS